MEEEGITVNELKRLRVIDLKEKLLKLDLSTSGLKADLVNRLYEAYQQQTKVSNDEKRTSKNRIRRSGTYELDHSSVELNEESILGDESLNGITKETNEDANATSSILNTTFNKSDSTTDENDKTDQKTTTKKDDKICCLQENTNFKTPLAKFSFVSNTPGSLRTKIPKHSSGLFSKINEASKTRKNAKESKIPKKKQTGGISKLKTPNFAKIHQKQFEKMESLSDYVHKKEKLKAGNSARNFTPINIRPTLSVNFKGANASSTKKKFQKTPAPRSNGEPSAKPLRYNRPINLAMQIDCHKTSKLKSPKIKVKNVLHDSSNTKTATFAPREQKSDDGRSLKKFKFNHRRLPKPTFQEKHMKLKGKKSEEDKVLGIRENQREYVRGIRTNKRFELQMKMRNQIEKSKLK